MKIKNVLPAALLLLTFTFTFTISTAHAQTLPQVLAKQLNEAELQITSSPLAQDFKADFSARLGDIGMEARCRISTASRRVFECGAALPTVIELALQKIEQLSKEFNATFAAVGNKTLQQLYAPKLEVLGQKIVAGKIDGKEGRPLQDRIKVFFEPSDPRSSKYLVPAMIESKYQTLAADVDAAIKLSAASASSSAFLMQYQDKVKATERKVDASRLNSVTKNDLMRDLSMLTSPIVNGSIKPSPAEFAKADADLNTFNSRVDQTILVEGSKSFKELATVQLEALQNKIRAAKLDRADSLPLETDIALLRKQIDVVAGNIVSKRGGMTLDEFNAVVTKVSMDIDATIALVAQRGAAKTLLEALINKGNALTAKIERANLNPFFHNDFAIKANQITAPFSRGCAVERYSKQLAACGVDVLAEAGRKLDALSTTVDGIIATYGSKRVGEIYTPQINEALSNLNRSLVSARDKTNLTHRAKTVTATVREADKNSPKAPNHPGKLSTLTPEELHNEVMALIGEINAAMRIAGQGK